MGTKQSLLDDPVRNLCRLPRSASKIKSLRKGITFLLEFSRVIPNGYSIIWPTAHTLHMRARNYFTCWSLKHFLKTIYSRNLKHLTSRPKQLAMTQSHGNPTYLLCLTNEKPRTVRLPSRSNFFIGANYFGCWNNSNSKNVFFSRTALFFARWQSTTSTVRSAGNLKSFSAAEKQSQKLR